MDLRFPDRFAYVEELRRLGAKIEREGNIIIIQGPQKLHAGRVVARDLRAGAALIAASAAIGGKVVIERAEEIERGYGQMVDKLRHLGMKVSVSR